MNQEPANAELWSEEKLARLQAQLVGEWAEDSWTLLGTTDKGDPTERILHFSLVHLDLKVEMKYACWYYLTQGRGPGQHPQTQRKLLSGFQHFVMWLNQVAPPIRSLLERNLEFWICSLRTWLVQTGQYAPNSVKYLKATQAYQEYRHEDRHVGLFGTIYSILIDAYDTRQEKEKDIRDSA